MTKLEDTKNSLEHKRVLFVLREFQESQDACTEALQDWGIRPHYPEGRFFTALLKTQNILGELVLATLQDMKTLTQAADQKAELDLQKLRLANDQALLLVEHARIDRINTMHDRDTQVAKIVAKLGEDLVTGVKDWTVMRERELNRKWAFRRSMITAFLAVLIFIGGYGAHIALQERSGAVFKKCRETSKWYTQSGEILCPLSDLIP